MLSCAGRWLVPMLACGVLFAASAVRANGWEHAAIPFDALLSALASPNAAARRHAGESLGARGQPEAVGPLIRALARPEVDPGVRRSLYSALGHLGDTRATDVLIRCLQDEAREEIRAECAASIGLIADQRGLGPLLAALGADPSRLVRSRATDALGRYSSRTSVEALSRLLRDVSDQNQRLRAIRALGNTRSEEAVEPLLQRLAASSDHVEGVAIAQALTRIGSKKGTAALRSAFASATHPELRAHLSMALAATRDGDAYPAFVQMLADESPSIRYFAIRGIRELGRPEGARPLTRYAADASAKLEQGWPRHWAQDPLAAVTALELQTSALRALVELDPRYALPAFVRAAKFRPLAIDSAATLKLAEAVYELRRVALYGLGYTRSREAADLLASDAGLGDTDFRLRAAAARSLGVLGFPEAAEQMERALADPSPEVRWTAAMVLGRLKHGTAAAKLAERLSDEVAEVRKQAALSLGYLGHTGALPRLRQLAAEDPSPRVREASSLAVTLLTR